MTQNLNQDQLQQMKSKPGFIAALDQSGGSTPHALASYGVKDHCWADDDEMFDLVHQMRTRIITSPSFTSERIIGAILFEDTMDREIEGRPTADYLWNVKRVVPFLKVDKGLAAEQDGVQMMKPMPDLDALLDKAKAKGIFGTKMRSVIKHANPTSIQANCEPAVRICSADHRRRPGADCRAGSGHSLSGKSSGRGSAQSGHAGKAQRLVGGATGDAEAHPARSAPTCMPTSSVIPRSCAWSRCRAAIRSRKPTTACGRITASWRASRGRWSKV